MDKRLKYKENVVLAGLPESTLIAAYTLPTGAGKDTAYLLLSCGVAGSANKMPQTEEWIQALSL